MLARIFLYQRLYPCSPQVWDTDSVSSSRMPMRMAVLPFSSCQACSSRIVPIVYESGTCSSHDAREACPAIAQGVPTSPPQDKECSERDTTLLTSVERHSACRREHTSRQ